MSHPMFNVVNPGNLPPENTALLLRLDPAQVEQSSHAPPLSCTVGYLVPEPGPGGQRTFREANIARNSRAPGHPPMQVNRGHVIPMEAVTGWMEIPR